LESAPVGDLGDPLCQGGAQFHWIHPRQETQVQMQLAFTADAVWIVAAMDVAQIDGGVGDRKGGMPMGLLQLGAPVEDDRGIL
jgi:hypothetical protein